MASINKYQKNGKTAWKVQYYSPDNKKRTKRGFDTKAQAEKWTAENTINIANSTWISNENSNVRINALAETWLATGEWKPSWRSRLAQIWANTIEPEWGNRTVASIRQSEIRTWLTDLNSEVTGKPLSGSSKRHILTALTGILDMGVADKLIVTNPARGFPLPVKEKPEKIFLTSQEVSALASVSSKPEIIWTLATTGMRFGELAGLQVKDVDFAKRRIKIERNAVWVSSELHIGTPKTNETRSITAPQFIFDYLLTLTHNKLPNAWVFSNTAEPLRRPKGTRGWFDHAVTKALNAGLISQRITLHDLRHTAASLLVAQGATVKVIQRQLGHASAAMTLDTYAGLFPDDLDTVAQAMNASFAGLHSE